MTRIKMTVITEAEAKGQSVLAPPYAGPVITARGDLNYECGQCGTELLAKVAYKQVVNIVIKCGQCGAHNIVPPTHNLH